MNSALLTSIRLTLSVLAPPPDLTVSQWADEYRRLSPESSAEPGRWVTSRAAYQQGIMDAFSDPKVETTVIMSSAQIGKTEMVNNVVGYFIDQDPSPMLVVQPTLELGQAWSKDRLAPMLRDTPRLAGRVRDVKSRAAENTITHKKFPGGHITICGANSPSSLASRPIRVVLLDEVDRYPASAGAEGDPTELAWKRATTFWNRKRLMCSTPTVKGFSRIEAAFKESDQRYYHVPCPACGTFQVLRWANVRWPKGHPEAATYQCDHCGVHWSDGERRRAIALGFWEATEPFHGVAGFHIWEAYSPWSTLGAIALAFDKARKQPDRLQVFVNTSLGETWEEDESQTVDAAPLSEREEVYGPEVPEGVGVLTAGVDTQDDRLEVEVVGWGLESESWSLEYKIFYGDTNAPQVWSELRDYLVAKRVNVFGRLMPLSCTMVDTGGHATAMAYKFCKENERHRIYAAKGQPNPGKEIVGRPSKRNKGKVKLFPLGVDTAKELLYARLRIAQPGPGYCHFPVGRDKEYYEQLTAETLVTKYVQGRPTRSWVQKRKRNEALDCRVYALCAFSLLTVNMAKKIAGLSTPPKGAVVVTPDPYVLSEEKAPESLKFKEATPARKRRRAPGSFATRW